MSWYPDPKPVPATLDTDDLHLEMLAPEHVELDYAALMSTRERLLHWSGGRWPHEGFTLDENMADMVMHRDEFINREAFTYTVLNHARDRCQGCVYIYPLGSAAAAVSDARVTESAARVSWWVRDEARDAGLDDQLIAGLIDWFHSAWEFDAVTFIARPDDQNDIGLLEAAGLQRVAMLQDENGPGDVALYLLPT